MGREWLLLEVLGEEPVVVAQGFSLRKFIPIATFLRRNDKLDFIRETVDLAVRSKQGSLNAMPGGKDVMRTEVVTMSDGRVHGLHVWTGPRSMPPVPRPCPGAVVWDLTSGTACDTRQALANAGFDVEAEKTEGRSFAADMPIGDINDGESVVLARSMSCTPGDTFCSTWDVTSHQGEPIRVSFVARAALEIKHDGAHLVCRAMNWRVPSPKVRASTDHLASQILRGLAQEGIHRAMVDLRTWTLLKWLDPPFPHADWRGETADQSLVHPEDRPTLRNMTQQFETGPASALMRLRAVGGGWVLIHATVVRVRLLDDAYAGLISIRLPTPAEMRYGSRFSAG